MSEPISLAALRAAHEAATGGEWGIGSPSIDGEPTIRSTEKVYATTNVVCRPTAPRDAAAIVVEHNAMPALLEIVDLALSAEAAGAFDDIEEARVLAKALAKVTR